MAHLEDVGPSGHAALCNEGGYDPHSHRNQLEVTL